MIKILEENNNDPYIICYNCFSISKRIESLAIIGYQFCYKCAGKLGDDLKSISRKIENEKYLK